MIENRDLTMDDYLAMVRRRLKVILIPALLAPLAGFLVSFAFPAKYTSQSLVLVEPQKVPDNYVQPVIMSDFSQRFVSMKQRAWAPNRVRQMVDRLGIARQGEEAKIVEDIVTHASTETVADVSSVPASSSGSTKKTKKRPAAAAAVPGFYVTFTSNDSGRAQQICDALTGLLTQENLETRASVARGTTEFLGRQVDDAKQGLDAKDKELADFKRKFIGQLPGDAENNLRILMSLNSQLDAGTQTLNRAQQDKAYTESLLAQQLAAWKASQSTTNPQTLEQQLNSLQAQLVQLQARYTEDHPDVIKTRADIAGVKKKLAEINDAPVQAADANQKSNASEPPEIRQLRLQIHQYEAVIAQATSDQKRLQSQIQLYQSRTAMSPTVEEQYKVLTRDYDQLKSNYDSLVAKKSASELATSMESAQQGEQVKLLIPAGPGVQTEPKRLLFAGGGLGAGLLLGLALAIWLEVRDKSIRTERDASVALELPLLVSVPWVAEEDATNGNGKLRLWRRGNGHGGGKDKERIEA